MVQKELRLSEKENDKKEEKRSSTNFRVAASQGRQSH